MVKFNLIFYNVSSSIFWYQILAWIWGKCSVKWSSCLHGSDRNQTAANQQCFSPLISVQEYQICYIFLLLSLCSYIVKSEVFVSSDVPLNFRDTYYLTAYFLNLMLFFHFFPILSLVWKSWCRMCLFWRDVNMLYMMKICLMSTFSEHSHCATTLGC